MKTMKSWFKGKLRHFKRGIPDNFGTSLPAENLQHQTNNATYSCAPTSDSTIPESSTYMYDSYQPSTAYPYHHYKQGSFKLNAGKNGNKKGTQRNGGIKVGTIDFLLHYKDIELNTGDNLNEGEIQVNNGIELCDVDGIEGSESLIV